MHHFETGIGNDLGAAIYFLNRRDCVAIPTETVYGLAANALDQEAVLSIFAIKNRPHFDPLIVHVADTAHIHSYVKEIPAKAQLLMDAFMPGPLTLLLPKKDIIPDIVTSGLNTVAIRVPNHPITQHLLKQLDYPLAAPSANPFGYISPTTAQHVYDQLQGKIPYIVDGGPCHVGVESTIIGFEGEEVIVYRLGGMALEQIEAVAGKVNKVLESGSDPRSPGMLKSHYAPRKKLYFDPAHKVEGEKIAVIAFDHYLPDYSIAHQVLLAPSGNLEEAAKKLFAVMRQLDAGEADCIVAVRFPETGLGLAINDRLQRASA